MDEPNQVLLWTIVCSVVMWIAMYLDSMPGE